MGLMQAMHCFIFAEKVLSYYKCHRNTLGAIWKKDMLASVCWTKSFTVDVWWF